MTVNAWKIITITLSLVIIGTMIKPSITGQITNKNKTRVELFVMSYCPFGTQAEKGIIPAIRALGNNVDFKVRFVYYSMHGQRELNENLRQYCIQKEQPSKLLDYLTCFLNNSDSGACLTSLKININSCMSEADEEFNITSNYENKATWLNGHYPLCDIDKSLNAKYSIRGSPTLVINGKTVQPSNRSPEAYLNSICDSMINKPVACDKTLSSNAYSPGFGYSTGSSNTATCG